MPRKTNQKKLINFEEIRLLEKMEDYRIDGPPSSIFLYNVFLQLQEICKTQNLQSLSAVRVGEPIKAFVAKDDAGEFIWYYNCSYQPICGETQLFHESCSLFPNRAFLVNRFKNINLIGKILNRSNISKEINYNVLDVLESRLFQYEIDCCDLRYISEVGAEVNMVNYYGFNKKTS